MAAPNPIFVVDLMGEKGNPPAGIFAKDLANALRDIGLRPELLDGATRERLFDAILQLRDAIEQNAGHFPVIHFFGHGDRDGVAVYENNEKVKWPDLCGALQPLQEALRGNVVFCFDVCHGLQGFKVARRFFPLPFLALIGPNREIDADLSLRAFTEFYKASAVEIADLDTAVRRMNDASGYVDERYEWVIGTKWTFDFTGKVKGIELIPDK